MLNILEGYDLATMGHNSAAYVHHLTEAMRRAFRDRARFVADPDFADVPIEQLTSKEYASIMRADIAPDQATPSDPSDIALPFWMQTRAETITEEKLELLKNMGIHRMGLGIEHGNDYRQSRFLSAHRRRPSCRSATPARVSLPR